MLNNHLLADMKNCMLLCLQRSAKNLIQRYLVGVVNQDHHANEEQEYFLHQDLYIELTDTPVECGGEKSKESSDHYCKIGLKVRFV